MHLPGLCFIKNVPNQNSTEVALKQLFQDQWPRAFFFFAVLPCDINWRIKGNSISDRRAVRVSLRRKAGSAAEWALCLWPPALAATSRPKSWGLLDCWPAASLHLNASVHRDPPLGFVRVQFTFSVASTSPLSQWRAHMISVCWTASEWQQPNNIL